MSNEHAFPGNVDGLDEVPAAIRPYMGCPDYVKNIDPHTHGYPSYMPRALERQQLDRSILACDATHAFLYGGAYTPPRADYAPGTRPLLEQIVVITLLLFLAWIGLKLVFALIQTVIPFLVMAVIIVGLLWLFDKLGH